MFYVTTPSDPKAADILLVGARDGKVLERKHIATNGHDTASYARKDNCEHFGGY